MDRPEGWVLRGAGRKTRSAELYSRKLVKDPRFRLRSITRRDQLGVSAPRGAALGGVGDVGQWSAHWGKGSKGRRRGHGVGVSVEIRTQLDMC